MKGRALPPQEREPTIAFPAARISFRVGDSLVQGAKRAAADIRVEPVKRVRERGYALDQTVDRRGHVGQHLPFDR